MKKYRLDESRIKCRRDNTIGTLAMDRIRYDATRMDSRRTWISEIIDRRKEMKKKIK